MLPAGPRPGLRRRVGRARRGVAEPDEQLDLLLAVPAYGVVGRQLADQLAHARAQLVGEMRRGWTDEGVDVVRRRLGHASKANE